MRVRNIVKAGIVGMAHGNRCNAAKRISRALYLRRRADIGDNAAYMK